MLTKNIGFLGGSGLYKTTDGGEHWKQVFGSSDVNYRLFTSIQFLDANVGFAVYDCIESDAPCTSGLMRTTNGGSSWTEFHIGDGVQPRSIFFTSPMTRYLASVFFTPEFWELEPSLGINKTIDGGVSWGGLAFVPVPDMPDTVFYPPRAFKTSIGFTNSTRFIYLTDVIWVTTMVICGQDHSLTKICLQWILLVKNIICAILSNVSAGNPSSSIIRSTDGSTWQDVADFSHEIDHIQFSPSGNLGITVGVNITDAGTNILFINKSVDKGLTWAQEGAKDHIMFL